ncbi:SDR family oxidoreductase [Streptomyces sp. 3214.6]|uniref:SDR family oxidoreductase n=1 Tax=Streptomyces sp. 3214.6 TaxID=1882757 RepID=UPI00090CC9B2|nr:SDR family oxidoreductase [Streptomyces sp. 3214.6]SHH29617.1 3-oxoacyl-[acyl-carrier-protein] reductase /acetoacetyl-CoA reductase [Streptomyces sp. 3214.6]
MSQRVAIVTGGARGIGAAIAARLAADGDAVAIFDLDERSAERTAQAIRDRGDKAIALTVDVSQADSVQSAVAAVAERLGPPTVLVSNAGVIRDNLLFRMDEADWDTVMNVHLKGAFLTAKAAHSYMRDIGHGRIVVLSSTSALGKRGQANYATAKAGLQGFVKTLAIELGRFGITANAIAPGYIVTDMAGQTAGRLGITVEELTARNLPSIPVGRAGTPEDIAHAASFFASEGAGFVTGQVLYVAGGPRA